MLNLKYSILSKIVFVWLIQAFLVTGCEYTACINAPQNNNILRTPMMWTVDGAKDSNPRYVCMSVAYAAQELLKQRRSMTYITGILGREFLDKLGDASVTIKEDGITNTIYINYLDVYLEVSEEGISESGKEAFSKADSLNELLTEEEMQNINRALEKHSIDPEKLDQLDRSLSYEHIRLNSCVYHMDVDIAKRRIRECLLNLKISDSEEIRKILKELEGLIISMRNNHIDDSNLIEALPAIAEELGDSKLFVRALKIEALFFKLLANSVVYYEWKGICTDYGCDMSGIIGTRAISKSVFSIYRGLFKERTKLADFLNLFPQAAEQKKESIDTEGKLIEYLYNITGGKTATLKKCIVLDADGVLWDGVIGEDGIDGIKITPRHIEFQKRIKSLKESGVILAINSKNNPEDVENVFENRPDMVLKKGDFAIIKANWQDKATNIKEISLELNIDIGSLVFLDDSPHERELVNVIYPDVLTIDPSNDPVVQIESLSNSGLFSKRLITEEDKRRTELYLAQKEREESKKSFKSIEDYFSSLKMKVVIREGDENLASIPRIAQLTQRTNQFNLTTKRYSDKDIRSFLENKDYIVYTLELSDKFGNAGIVGLIILHRTGPFSYEIDTFCLSCRAVRLTVEDAFMASVTQDLKNTGVNVLYGVYLKAERNTLVKDLYHRFGFQKVEDLREVNQPSQEVILKGYRWALDILQSDLKIPDWIAVTHEKRRNASLKALARFKPIWDIFYKFLDIPENKIARGLLVQRIDEWLSLIEGNNIRLTTEDVEFLISLTDYVARSDIKKSRREYLEEILRYDIKLLKRKVAPDLRNISTVRVYYDTVHAYCDYIDEMCSAIFKDSYVIYLNSEDHATGMTDNWLGQVLEYNVNYYRIGSIVPVGALPSLVITLHNIYEYKLTSRLDENLALKFTENWWMKFYSLPKLPYGEQDVGVHALHLLHWKELLADRSYIESKL